MNHDDMFHILNGTVSKHDAINAIRKYAPFEYYDLYLTFVSQKSNNVISNFEFVMDIDMIEKMSNIEKCNDVIDKLKSSTDDIVQINVLERIKNIKNNDDFIVSCVNDNAHCKRKCPFCDNVVNGNVIDTRYVICGHGLYCDMFSNENKYAYFMNKNSISCCGNEWCFVCEKILCKNWTENKLYDINNRKHDEDCCRTHAQKYSKMYPFDYCQCISRS